MRTMIVAAVLAFATAGSATAAPHRTYLACGFDGSAVLRTAPASCDAGLSAKVGVSFLGARWSGWGTAVAKARATAYVNGHLRSVVLFAERLDLDCTHTHWVYSKIDVTIGKDSRLVRVKTCAPLPGRAASSLPPPPSTDWAYGLTLQTNGKLVAVGLSRPKPGAVDRDRFALARYTAGGELDASFGHAGKVLTGLGMPTRALAVAVQADGRLVVAGGEIRYQRPEPHALALARYGAAGALDSTFGRHGTIVLKGVDAASAVAVERDRRILAGGGSWDSGALTRYTRRGQPDAAFARGKMLRSFTITGLAVDRRGRIVAAGYKPRRHPGDGVERFNRDGTLDKTFGTGGIALTGVLPTGVALARDGSIVVVGENDLDFGLVRLTPDGDLDSSFGTDGKVVTNFGDQPGGCKGSKDCQSDDFPNAVVVQPDGKIVAAGTSNLELGASASAGGSGGGTFALARYNPDGSLDASFGRGGKVVTSIGRGFSSSVAQAVVVQPNGKLVAAGLASGYDFGLVRYTSRGGLDPTFGTGGKVVTDFGSR